MKILITGSNGMLGSVLASHLSVNYQVFGIDVQPANMKSKNIIYHQCDITDQLGIDAIITDINPTIVINCAAFTSVDRCETEQEFAKAINVTGVKNLIQSLEDKNAHFIQISSDYVFDGTDGPYLETDNTNPINNYGKMKLEAEVELKQSKLNWTIIRTNVLFSDNLSEPASFVSWVYQNLKKMKKLMLLMTSLAIQPMSMTWPLRLKKSSNEMLMEFITMPVKIISVGLNSRYK